MPLEIKELIVRINIQQNIKEAKTTESNKISKNLRKQIVQECMEKVMEMIERKKDR